MIKKREIRERKPLTNNVVHPDPLLNRIYTNRGISDPKDLEYNLSKILSPWLMKDMDAGVQLIIKHIYAKSNILIVGDYDCDGATSTTIAIEGLLMCGADSVDFIVPDRHKHGYGLSKSLVHDIKKLHKPSLIITVDNGISAFEGAEEVAKALPKCDLLITDHHLADSNGNLPIACAIINPNRIDCEFPSKEIAGCGVIFYLIMALRNRMGEQGDFVKLGLNKPDIRHLLDVLALGTIADVVTLDENNRILVSAGLERMNRGQVRYGIKAILDVANKKIGELVASDMGFALGPRINAAGRMSDMAIGIRCLLSNSHQEAMEIANELDKLNVMRKSVELGMVEEANLNVDFDENQFGISLIGKDFHEGVVGIVAARIKEQFNRPVICFTHSEPIDGDEILKGSARSVKGVHLKHALVEIQSTHPEIFVKFGGHAMAAGLSIRAKFYDVFAKMFNEVIQKHITQDIINGLIEVDVIDIREYDLTIDKAKAIELGGPWGQNFEEPLFEGKFNVIEEIPMGDKLNPKHLRLILEMNNVKFSAVWFNSIPDTGHQPFTDAISIVFTLNVNRFRGSENLQLMVRHAEQLTPVAETIKPIEIPVFHESVNPLELSYQRASLTTRKSDKSTTCTYMKKADIINKVLN